MTDVKTFLPWTELKPACLLLLFFAASACLLAFASLTDPAFGAHGDLPVHYHLARAFNQSLAEGDWLPRWAGLLNGGRGDAFFTFYPPLFYWLAAATARLAGVDLLSALKFVALLSLLLAQVHAYLFARTFFQRWQSVLAALLFVWLPAYVLLILQVSLLPNSLALSFVPLALLAAHRLLLNEGRRGALALFAFSVAAIVCTHVITIYLCALALSVMALSYLPEARWQGLAWLALGGVLVLALTAFFLAPQQLEMSWVNVKLQTAQQDFRNYFLFAPAPDDSSYRQAWAALNDSASWITLLQTAGVLLLGAALWRQPQPRRQRLLLRFCLALTVLGLFLALPLSRLLWEHLPGLAYLQFPWRFQPLVALGGALLTACYSACWPQFRPRARTLLTFLLTSLLLLLLVFTYAMAKGGQPGVGRGPLIPQLERADLQPATIEQVRALTSAKDPRFLAFCSNQVYFRPQGADLLLYPAVQEYGGLSFINGKGHILRQQLNNEYREFRLRNEGPVRVRLNTYAYPHWLARLDGREVQSEAEAGSGLLLLELPAGEHTLSFAYEVRSPAALWARRLSAITWLGFLVWLFWLGQARLRQASAEQELLKSEK